MESDNKKILVIGVVVTSLIVLVMFGFVVFFKGFSNTTTSTKTTNASNVSSLILKPVSMNKDKDGKFLISVEGENINFKNIDKIEVESVKFVGGTPYPIKIITKSFGSEEKNKFIIKFLVDNVDESNDSIMIKLRYSFSSHFGTSSGVSTKAEMVYLKDLIKLKK